MQVFCLVSTSLPFLMVIVVRRCVVIVERAKGTVVACHELKKVSVCLVGQVFAAQDLFNLGLQSLWAFQEDF